MDLITAMGIGFVLTWQDKGVKKGLKEVKEEARLLERGIRNLGVGAHAVRSSLDRIGGAVSSAASVVSRAMGGMVSSAIDFDDAMRRALSSLGMEGFKESFEPLRQVALDTAREFGMLPAEVARGMESVVKGGVTGVAQIGAVTRAAVQGALLDQEVSVAQMSEMLIDVSNAIGRSMDSETITETSQRISAAAAASTIGLKNLKESLKFLAPQIANFGLDFEGALAAISTLGAKGIKGTLAGTALERMMIGVSTAKSQRLQAGLGWSPVDEAGAWKQYIGVAVDAMDAIEKRKLESNGKLTQLDETRILNEMFKERGSRAAISLAAEKGKLYNEMLEKIRNSNSLLNEGTQIIKGGYKGAWDQLKSTIATVGIQIFDRFGPEFMGTMERSIKWTGDLISAFVALKTGGSLDGLSDSAVNFARGLDDAIGAAKKTIGEAKEFIGGLREKFESVFGAGATDKLARWMGTFAILSPILGPLISILSGSIGILFSVVTLFTGMLQAFMGIHQIVGGAGGLLTKLGANGGLLGSLKGLAPYLAVGGLIVLGDWDRFKIVVEAAGTALSTFVQIASGAASAVGSVVKDIGDAFWWLNRKIAEVFVGPFKTDMDKVKKVHDDLATAAGVAAAAFAAAWAAASSPVLTLLATMKLIIEEFKYWKNFVTGEGRGWSDAEEASKMGRKVYLPGEAVPFRNPLTGKTQWSLPDGSFSNSNPAYEKPHSLLDMVRKAKTSVPPPKAADTAKPATHASAEGMSGPPREAMVVNAEIKMDGRKVGGGIARVQQELAERAGAKASPWQRRAVVERGVIAPTMQWG